MKYYLPLLCGISQRWKDPLYRNFFLILLSYIASAGLGFFFWMLAAKFYPKEDVGIASALIASITLLILLSGFGLGESIIRFFPEGDKSKIFSTSVIITTFFAVLIGIIFIIGIDIWSPKLGILKSSNAIIYLLFLAIASVVTLTNISFIAMRKAEFSFLQNLILGLRVVFLLPFIFFGALGIFGSYGVSFVFACFIMVFFLVKSGVTPTFTLDRLFLREAFHFSAGSYLAQLLITIPTLILPIMVLNVLGAEKTAQYYIAYSIALILFMIPSAVSTSLFVEGSHGETLKKNTFKSLFIIISLLIPAAIILYIFGGLLLSIIGRSYVEGFDLLRILVLSSFFVALVNVYFSIKKVQKDLRSLVLLSGLLFVLLIGLSYIFMLQFGIVGVGYAWMVGYGSISMVIGIMVWRERWL